MASSRDELNRLRKHFERAQGWLLLGKHDEAAAALEEIPPGLRGIPEVMKFRLQLYLEAGRWACAEPVARQLVAAEPDEPAHWVQLAFATRRCESISAAELILQEANLRFPTVPVIWFNLACYAAQQGRLNEVGGLLEEACRLESAYRQLAREDPDLAPYWASGGPGSAGATGGA